MHRYDSDMRAVADPPPRLGVERRKRKHSPQPSRARAPRRRAQRCRQRKLRAKATLALQSRASTILGRCFHKLSHVEGERERRERETDDALLCVKLLPQENARPLPPFFPRRQGTQLASRPCSATRSASEFAPKTRGRTEHEGVRELSLSLGSAPSPPPQTLTPSEAERSRSWPCCAPERVYDNLSLLLNPLIRVASSPGSRIGSNGGWSAWGMLGEGMLGEEARSPGVFFSCAPLVWINESMKTLFRSGAREAIYIGDVRAARCADFLRRRFPRQGKRSALLPPTPRPHSPPETPRTPLRHTSHHRHGSLPNAWPGFRGKEAYVKGPTGGVLSPGGPEGRVSDHGRFRRHRILLRRPEELDLIHSLPCFPACHVTT